MATKRPDPDGTHSKFEPMSLRLADLQLIVAVASQGSLTAAAETMGLARSSVSRRLAEIEGRLGTVLIERTTRRVRPTAAGESFLHHARGALDAAADAFAACAEGGARGTVRVTAPPVLGPLVMTPALLQLLDEHPGVRVEVDTTGLYRDLDAQRLDVALRLGPADAVHPSFVLGWTGYRLVALPGSPAAGAEAPRDLDPDWLCGPLDSTLCLRRDGMEVQLAASGRVRTSDFGTLLAAVRAGVGAARLPEPMVRSALGSGGLVHVLPTWDAGRDAIRCVHRRPGRVAVDRLVELLAASPAATALSDPAVRT